MMTAIEAPNQVKEISYHPAWVCIAANNPHTCHLWNRSSSCGIVWLLPQAVSYIKVCVSKSVIISSKGEHRPFCDAILPFAEGQY